MNARELRRRYLAFFESKGHQRHASGSLIPYDVTGRLDESLLFNGAGMVQFKPYFRGVAQPPSKRLTNVQKCVRTGDIEEVGDLSHLTFFEMMGNFSFGDYFKKEAIALSWEFMTSPDWLNLDPKRLSFTVFEEDDEALEAWSGHLAAAGLDPATRIFRLGEETNYWPAGAFSKGPPGPCGPNSEMFYWTPNDIPPPPAPEASESRLDGKEGAGGGGSGYSKVDWLRDEAAGKWLEIWNDVFIQYEWKGRLRNPQRPADGYEKEGLEPLPFQSVDTGMGLERTATVLGGFRSVYATDVFEPVFGALAKVLEKNPLPPALEGGGEGEGGSDEADLHPSSSLGAGGGGFSASWTTGDSPADRAARIIVDHARTACFCIADGVLPGNSGRGYVLRRLIRRAVLKGQRTLGIAEPFLWRTYDGIVEACGDYYPELSERKETILETLRSEEELFRRTLQSGSEMLREMVEARPTMLSGANAFQLYDTYGFPLEVTQELCQEAGIEVDLDGFEAAMKEAQERSRAAHGMESVYGGVEGKFDELVEAARSADAAPTRFVGYETTEIEAKVVASRGAGILPAGAETVPVSEGSDREQDAPGARRQDAGATLAVVLDQSPFYVESGGEVSDTGVLRGEGFALEVLDLARQDGVIVHLCRLQDGAIDDLTGKTVIAHVDASRRRNITRNHTATHLLHAALRDRLGKHVTQAGSLVAPDHLRFDFTHGKALSDDELAHIEADVNAKALAAVPVAIHADVPIAEAKKRGAMALFGEKYGDAVRMVEVPGTSLELCGGCHVANTAEIGLFKILHESSAASGVRRIEAVTGEAAYRWAREADARLHEAAAKLKTSPSELANAVEKLQEQLREEKRRIERLRSQSAAGGGEEVSAIGPVELATQVLTEGEMKEATLFADRLTEGKPNRVAFVVLAADGKVALVAKAGAEAVAKGAHAGNLVREAAKAVGGGGGGRPDFATAGGKDPSKVAEAVAAAAEALRSQVGA